jgi:hypothetical protein
LAAVLDPGDVLVLLDHNPLLAAGPHPLQGQHALLERVHHPRHRAG